MDNRSSLTATRLRRKAPVATAPVKTGIASLAAWLGALPLASKGDRREAWQARREARELSSVAMNRVFAASAEVLAVMPTAQAPLYASLPVVPPAPPAPRRRQLDRVVVEATRVIPAAPVEDDMPDLLALLESTLPTGDVIVPDWLRAEAPRSMIDMPGPGEAPGAGHELFKLFRDNAGCLAELADLEDAEPAKPWWGFATR